MLIWRWVKISDWIIAAFMEWGNAIELTLGSGAASYANVRLKVSASSTGAQSVE